MPALAVLVGLLTMVLSTVGAGRASADSFTPISGAGSTWSQNAIDQWRQNVQQYGLTVNYQGTGSSDGRNQFRSSTVDFGVSEIPYGTTDDGAFDSPPSRPFAYMPIVAGGTSFMYNLKIGGQRVTSLRLSGDVITKIFTNVITSWNDPAIQTENPGLVLPARRIVPVVRSDGSGTSAQFTLWMSKQYTNLWNSYCSQLGIAAPCGQYSQYPVKPGTLMTAQSGSLGVAGYTAQDASEGAITYVEYSYALNASFPVVKVLNNAGYYQLPTANNVAVALLQAKINTDSSSPSYLTSILDGVYNNSDPRTYPLSSYSYMIVPTTTDGNFSTDKGKSLASFANYFLCEGQRSVAALGYSPLPINLAQAGIDQVKRIPGVTADNTDITKCNNPTFSASGTNLLATTAPQPAACDQAGPTQCGTSAVAASVGAAGATGTAAGGGTGRNTGGKSTGGTGRTTGGAAGAGGTSAGGTAAAGGTSAGGASGGQAAGGTSGGQAAGGTSGVQAAGGTSGGQAAGGTAGAPVDPAAPGNTDPAAGGGTTDSSSTGGGQAVSSQAVTLSASSSSGQNTALSFLAVGIILLVAVAPPLMWQRGHRRRNL